MPHSNPIPLVDHTILLQPAATAAAIAVGSPDWFAWLENASSFAFTSAHGTFTAHKERRGPSNEYWKAYRRRAGRLHRAYLGKSATLTLERLNAVAADLARGAAGHAPTNSTRAMEMTAQHNVAIVSTHPAPAAAPMPDNAQSLHLLTTKLMIPESRANLVPRRRLAQLLDVAIMQKQKLILISAPAGFGKTTLLVEWLISRTEGRGLRTEPIVTSLSPQSSVLSTRVAWLALDDSDNQLGHFLAYLIAALETVRPGIGADAWALLRTQVVRPPSQAILTILVNALADSSDCLILALDDYHTITRQSIHEALAFLLDRMPANMHVIMTTRADPPLALARLRVRGQLTELRAADLRFTRDEAQAFFDRVHAIHLPADAVTTLAARTEGWVAGLQMAALSLQQQQASEIPSFIADFTGSHHYVFDYLVEEVFQQQPEHVRIFLMQTGMLKRLCASLCDAVTGQANAQAMLEYLEQANLFLIKLDANRHWYRYHHLFRDFLRERLERAVAPAERALLYVRASAWFKQQGLVCEAIDYALLAQSWADAIRCIVPLMTSERMYEYYLDWPQWLAALPDAVLQADPAICLRLAWVLLFTGHVEASEHPLKLVEAIWQAADDRPQLGAVQTARAMAFYYRGDSLRALMLAQQALDMLPADAIESRAISTFVTGGGQIALGHVGTAIGFLIAAHEAIQHSSEALFVLASAFGVARAYQLQGRLQRAAAMYQDIVRRAGDAVHQQQPAVYINLGVLFYEWNDLAAAERTLHEGLAVGKRTGRGRYWPAVHSVLARVYWARGDAAQARAQVAESLASAQQLESSRHIAEAQAQQAWLWLAQGDLPAALRWASARALNTDDPIVYERQPEYLMLARIRIAQARQAAAFDDLSAVVRMLDRLYQAAQDDQRGAHQVEILAITALAYAAQGQQKQALVSQAAALTLAEPEGYMRTFIDQGAPMQSLLLAQRAQLLTSNIPDRRLAYINRLLDAFPPANPAELAKSASLLTAREHSVLQLLADGRSIPEIATRLIISTHTARTHIKNIYTKLDAHNRIQALDRARALQVL